MIIIGIIIYEYLGTILIDIIIYYGLQKKKNNNLTFMLRL